MEGIKRGEERGRGKRRIEKGRINTIAKQMIIIDCSYYYYYVIIAN